MSTEAERESWPFWSVNSNERLPCDLHQEPWRRSCVGIIVVRYKSFSWVQSLQDFLQLGESQGCRPCWRKVNSSSSVLKGVSVVHEAEGFHRQCQRHEQWKWRRYLFLVVVSTLVAKDNDRNFQKLSGDLHHPAPMTKPWTDWIIVLMVQTRFFAKQHPEYLKDFC